MNAFQKTSGADRLFNCPSLTNLRSSLATTATYGHLHSYQELRARDEEDQHLGRKERRATLHRTHNLGFWARIIRKETVSSNC